MMEKVTAPYMQVGFQKDVLYLGFGSIIKKVEEPSLQEIYLTCLDAWSIPCTFEKMNSLLQQKGYIDSSITVVLKEVLLKNYVINADIFYREERHSRNLLYFALSGGNPHAVQKRLQHSHVVILGCGGIGNMVSVCLATSGIGRLTLIDDDIIEVSNLTRQFLFTNRDVGQKKVDVLKKTLLERSDNTHIETFDSRVSNDLLQKLSHINLIVLSADSYDCLPIVTKYCSENRVPFLNVGYIQDIAVWGPLMIPGKTGCLFCQNVIANDFPSNQALQSMLQRINQRYQAPSIGSINMLASALSILDILKFLGGFGDEIYSNNKRIGLWTHSMDFEEQNCRRNDSCPFCSHTLTDGS